MRRIVPRKILFSVKELGEVEVAVPGIFGPRAYTLVEYTVEMRGLMYQRLPEAVARTASAPVTVKIAARPWQKYCRWHNHELVELEETPRVYCTAPAGPGDYCRVHRGSLKESYERCLRSTGSLEPCRAVDREAARKSIDLEYSLYLAWWRTGGQVNVKVGVTRSFRLIERVSEQPHVVATEVARFHSLEEARRWELRVSREGIARQQTRRTRVSEFSIAVAVRELASAAEKVASLIGVKWEGVMFRVKPPPAMRGLEPASPARVEGSTFRLTEYWGGMVALEAGDGARIALRASNLLHRASVDSLVEG